ncbi:MAG TPA: VOC family protein [Caulobacteraceae bacterium]|nr:VOC family protein [Caulobacteraceae bacterium]
MSDDHGRFIWYELMTPDLEAAKSFYSKVVGWTAQDMPMADGAYTVLEAAGAGVGGAMVLSAEHKAQGVPPNWTGYICVDDCDAAAEKAKALGGNVMRPPTDIPGIGRFAIITDPHGAVTAIMKPVPPSDARPRAPRGTLGHGAWHELYAGDAEADIPFYRELFGWTETGRFDMGPMGVYHLFGNADGQVGGIMTKPAQIPVACWCYYFEVDDADAAAERVKQAGGAIVQGPMDVPDGSRIVQATDPQGANFALVKTKL